MSRTSDATPIEGERPPEVERPSRRAAEALRKLSEQGGFKSIPDPVAWQREIRKDRPLAGRDE